MPVAVIVIRRDAADAGRSGPPRSALPEIAREAAYEALPAIVDLEELLPTLVAAAFPLFNFRHGEEHSMGETKWGHAVQEAEDHVR
jgi:hypothetical protein